MVQKQFLVKDFPLVNEMVMVQKQILIKDFSSVNEMVMVQKQIFVKDFRRKIRHVALKMMDFWSPQQSKMQFNKMRKIFRKALRNFFFLNHNLSC